MLARLIRQGYDFTLSPVLVLTHAPVEDIYVAQGAASDGEFFYFVLRNSGDTKAQVYKYSIKSGALVAESPVFNGGHCTDKTGYTAQGMGSDDSYVYFPMSKSKTDNVLVVYDWQGKFVTTLKIDLSIESESMFYAAGRYYVAFYAGSKVGMQLYEVKPVHYYTYTG
ncbi:MAG: hypothetical protein K6E37_05035 [Bacteroidales bacterium]|nr:hypothetical protein [Bacteroidales bacterium]